MELALSYADGLRDAVGTDRSLAATLVLHYLARHGFSLRPLAFRDLARDEKGGASTAHHGRELFERAPDHD